MKIRKKFLFVVFNLLALMLQGQTLYRVVDGTSATVNVEQLRKITFDNSRIMFSHFGENSDTLSLFHLYAMSMNNLVTSVEEQPFVPSSQQPMLLYPNPAHEQLSISIGAGIHHRVLVEVISIDGRIVIRDYHTLNNGQVKISIQQLPEGIYVCRVKAGEINNAVKFFKK
jgi:hypothetical protein